MKVYEIQNALLVVQLLPVLVLCFAHYFPCLPQLLYRYLNVGCGMGFGLAVSYVCHHQPLRLSFDIEMMVILYVFGEDSVLVTGCTVCCCWSWYLPHAVDMGSIVILASAVS